MKILVINAGSSSLKYQLIDMAQKKLLAKGNCECIGTGGIVTHKKTGDAPQRRAPTRSRPGGSSIPFPRRRAYSRVVAAFLLSGVAAAAGTMGMLAAALFLRPGRERRPSPGGVPPVCRGT